MACGRATIVSALECFQDFVTDGETGLVFNHRAVNASALLAEKIEKLILDKELRRRLGLMGSKTARESFSTATIAQVYLADFCELLDKKRQRAIRS
jgi:glycosyltransferase involved in cell wall biosynthesis